MSCPQCHSKHSQIKDGSTNAGSQRFRCTACGCRYTPNPIERGYDEEIRLQAFGLHQEGVSLREIGRILEVNHQTVANWINSYAIQMPEDLPPSILDIAVLDGAYVPPFLRKKTKK